MATSTKDKANAPVSVVSSLTTSKVPTVSTSFDVCVPHDATPTRKAMVRVVRQRLEKINLLGGFVEAFEKSVPAEGGALDAHRKLDDTLQRFDVAEFD